MQLPNELLAAVARNLDNRVDQVSFAILCKRTLDVARATCPQSSNISRHRMSSYPPVVCRPWNQDCNHYSDKQYGSFGPKFAIRFDLLMTHHRWLLEGIEPGWCLAPNCLKRARHPVRFDTNDLGYIAACSDECAHSVSGSSWCHECIGWSSPKSTRE